MARLTVIAPPDLGVGFRLAGTDVVTAANAAETGAALERLAADAEVGVVGVYAPLFDNLAPDTRRRWEDSVAPVVIAVPVGAAGPGARDHRARLASLLQRAIGYRISFGEDDEA
jgi:vacuolar-type H+-ATPase subunit F/Vma7